MTKVDAQPRLAVISGLSMTLTLAIVILRGWLQPLPSALWLDETGTYYMVSGSWNEFLERMTSTVQSPLYCTVLWVWAKIAGLSEVVLRLPSVLALGATAFFVYRLAARLVDNSAALLAAMAFVSMSRVMVVGIQARPYAFGMLAATIAVTLLLNWLSNKTPQCAIQCGVAVALLVYIQPLNITLAIGIMGMIVVGYLHGQRLPMAQVLLFIVTVTVAVAPITPYYWSVAKEADLYAFAEEPGFSGLGLVYGDSLLTGCVLLGLIAGSALFGRLDIAKVSVHPMALMILSFWMAVPPLLLFAYSKVSSNVFVERYYSIGFPAVAIAIALVIRHFDHPGVRSCVICSVAIGGVSFAWSSSAQPRFGSDDWREAAQVLGVQRYEDDTPIFVRTGFVEAKRVARLIDPKYREFILAPLHAYPVRGTIHALPDSPENDVGGYAVRLIAETTANRGHFFFYGSGRWTAWFEEKFSKGWKSRRLHPLVVEISNENVTQGTNP